MIILFIIVGGIKDIWFLVFGGIGYLADKRKLRYAVELEKYTLLSENYFKLSKGFSQKARIEEY